MQKQKKREHNLTLLLLLLLLLHIHYIILQPVKVLNDCYKALKPNGLLIIEVPHARE